MIRSKWSDPGETYHLNCLICLIFDCNSKSSQKIFGDNKHRQAGSGDVVVPIQWTEKTTSIHNLMLPQRMVWILQIFSK